MRCCSSCPIQTSACGPPSLARPSGTVSANPVLAPRLRHAGIDCLVCRTGASEGWFWLCIGAPCCYVLACLPNPLVVCQQRLPRGAQLSIVRHTRWSCFFRKQALPQSPVASPSHARRVLGYGAGEDMPELAPGWRALMERCWEEDPADRPSFSGTLPALWMLPTLLALLLEGNRVSRGVELVARELCNDTEMK